MSVQFRHALHRIRLGLLLPPIAGRGVIAAVLALTVLGGAARVATAGALSVISSFPGPYDTQFGFVPGAGYPPVCAPYAAPTLAEGPLLIWPTTQPHGILHMAANWSVGEFYTTGQYTFQEPLAALVKGVLPGSSWTVQEPRLLYDLAGNDPSGYGRFVNVAEAWDTTARQAWITIAASFIPEGSAAYNYTDECVYSIDANVQSSGPPTQFYAGWPEVGMSSDSLVITAGMYSFGDKRLQYTKFWIVPKRAVYNVPNQPCPSGPIFPSGIASGLQNADGSLTLSVSPAKSYAASPVTYLAAAPGGNALTVWTLDTQKLTISPGVAGQAIAVNTYLGAKPAQQSGSTIGINTNSWPLANVVYQPASGLWTVHTTACPWNASLSCMKWYQIDPGSGVAVQDNQYGYSDASVYAPAVAVNRTGNAVFVFNYSGPSYYSSIGYAGRYAGDTPNTLPYKGTLKSGVGIYDRTAPALKSAADIDPLDDNRFFVISAYASGQNGTCPDSKPNYDWTSWAGILSFTGSAPTPAPVPPGLRYVVIGTRGGITVVPNSK